MHKSPCLSGYCQGKTHFLPVRIYYADTDFSGVVYHGRYLEFMERGRTEFMRALGLADLMKQQQQEAGNAAGRIRAESKAPLLFAVSSLTIRYKAPASIDNLLSIETRAEKLTGARFFLRQRIWRDETLLTDSECCLVIIDAGGKPQRIPDSWRALCAA